MFMKNCEEFHKSIEFYQLIQNKQILYFYHIKVYAGWGMTSFFWVVIWHAHTIYIYNGMSVSINMCVCVLRIKILYYPLILSNEEEIPLCSG